MSTEHIEQDFVVHDAQAVGALGHIAGAGKRVLGVFEGVAGAFGIGGGLFGAFKLHETIGDLDRMYKSVGRLKALTGAPAGDVHALAETFKMGGIEAEHTERIILSLSKKAYALEGGTKAAKALASAYKKLGVDVKNGPNDALLSMSRAAVSGKLGTGGLMAMFQMPKRDAGDFLKMLKRGPEALKGDMEEALHSSGLINDAALKSFDTMQRGKREMSRAWDNLVGTLYKNVLPIGTRLFTGMTHAIESWTPAIVKFGGFLTSHMEQAVKLAKVYAGYMAVNKVSGLVTGSGAISNAKKVAGFVGKFGAGALSGMGNLRSIGGAVRTTSVVNGVLTTGEISKTATMAYSLKSLGMAIGPLAKAFGKMTLIGFVIDGVIHAVGEIIHNVDGIRTRLGGIFGSIGEQFKSALSSMKPLFNAFDRVGKFVGKTMLFAFEGLAGLVKDVVMPAFRGVAFVIGKLSSVIQWVLDKIPSIDTSTTSVEGNDVMDMMHGKFVHRVKGPLGNFIKPDDLARSNAEAGVAGWLGNQGAAFGKNLWGRATEQVQKQEVNFFPGATINNQQNFSPGMDADRVMSAMTSQIMKRGEMRLSSNQATIFSGRP